MPRRAPIAVHPRTVSASGCWRQHACTRGPGQRRRLQLACPSVRRRKYTREPIGGRRLREPTATTQQQQPTNPDSLVFALAAASARIVQGHAGIWECLPCSAAVAPTRRGKPRKLERRCGERGGRSASPISPQVRLQARPCPRPPLRT